MRRVKNVVKRRLKRERAEEFAIKHWKE
ncbi:hypothetical protein JHU04_002880 [Brenneria sp. 4F2]|nr:hypothetical protein [Brenneria bubanii]